MFKINSCEDQNYSGIPEREREGGGGALRSQNGGNFLCLKNHHVYTCTLLWTFTTLVRTTITCLLKVPFTACNEESLGYSCGVLPYEHHCSVEHRSV